MARVDSQHSLGWNVTGDVQGVGFRPYVLRVARAAGVRGWVRNRRDGVEIAAAGTLPRLLEFEVAVQHFGRGGELFCCQRAPVSSEIDSPDFRIVASVDETQPVSRVPVDRAICPDCISEFYTPGHRRYGYVLIGCAVCGPRYSGVVAMPFERQHTALAPFQLCQACARDYGNPNDRRFHAQMIACAGCGPDVFLRVGNNMFRGQAALNSATAKLCAGEIVAVKGVGGYHLFCDATDERAVQRLRARKNRPAKPFAVMMTEEQLMDPALGLQIDTHEYAELQREARPVVLLRRRNRVSLADPIAPGLACMGVLLPYTGVHLRLLEQVGRPLIATSGNVSGEPVILDEETAEHKLSGIADAFLHHDRPIVNRADDPVIRYHGAVRYPIRLGRGNAPLELELPIRIDRPLLAVGGHQRNAIALAWDKRVVVSPSVGDLGSVAGVMAFESTAAQLQHLYGVSAAGIVCDAHPHYASSQWARRQRLPITTVWHHVAHAEVACYGHGCPDSVLVFAWDGLGLGKDGTLWGGEALVAEGGTWTRFASMRPYRLPGGDATSRQPWRVAASLLWAEHMALPWVDSRSRALHQAWMAGLNAPWCSSIGRLFDAAAVLLGLVSETSYDGEAPMRLEAAAEEADLGAPDLPLLCDDQGVWRSDWGRLLPMLCDSSHSVSARARLFHGALINVLCAQAACARERRGVTRIGFAGGVFQNAILTRVAAQRLEQNGFEVMCPPPVPINDGGLALGQMLHAIRQGGMPFENPVTQ